MFPAGADALPGVIVAGPEPDDDSWLDEIELYGEFDPGDEPIGPLVDPDRRPSGVRAVECDIAAEHVAAFDDGDLLNLTAAVDKLVSWAVGLRTSLVAEYADRHSAGSSAPPPGARVASPVSRWLPDELGMALNVDRQYAQNMIAGARRLAHVLPDTLAALREGRIDEYRAGYLSHATQVLDDDTARAVEADVLARAEGASVRQWQDRTRRAIHRHDPDGEKRRHVTAKTERRVTIRPQPEGMASLWAFGSAVDTEASFTMLTRLARSLGPADPRTLDQRRSDLLHEIVQGRMTVTDLADLSDLAALVAAGDPSTEAAHTATTDPTTGKAFAPKTEPTSKPASGSGAADRSDAGSPTVPGIVPPAGADARRSGTDDDGAVGGPREPGTENGHRDEQATGRDWADPSLRARLVDAVAEALARQPRASDTVRKPLVQLVVGIDTLRDGSDRPAELVGHGPVDADTARDIAADALWNRLATDPVSGRLLDHGRKTYRPPPATDDHVRARDQLCRGPLCSRRARDGDLDHHQAWTADHGPTDESNLYALCRHHHWLKDADDWSVIAHPDGSLTWISPAGRRHTTEPYDYRAFTEPMPGPPPPHEAERPDVPTSGATRATSLPPRSIWDEPDPSSTVDDPPPPF